jgi:uracil-DNA glycosylase
MNNLNWEELQNLVRTCTKCRLSTTRTQTVFGEGDPEADLFFIGEGPGTQEDKTGRPFVGRSGDLLTRLIEKYMGIPRSSVFIANIVKCRPSVDMKMEKDRPPEKDEVEACSPYLLHQIEMIQPKVIVTLGNPATKFILKTNEGITTLRGSWRSYKNIPVMPTYHPSFILRNGGLDSKVQKDVCSDLDQVMEKLGIPKLVTIRWKD